MAVDPIPAGYPRVTPYLCCRGAGGAIDFYKAVFGAVERMRMPGDSPDDHRPRRDRDRRPAS